MKVGATNKWANIGTNKQESRPQDCETHNNVWFKHLSDGYHRVIKATNWYMEHINFLRASWSIGMGMQALYDCDIELKLEKFTCNVWKIIDIGFVHIGNHQQ